MRNTTKALALAFVLMSSSTAFANGGIIITDRAETPCNLEKNGILLTDRTGIIITDRESGIVKGLVEVIAGILVSDSKTSETCVEKNGILVSDRTGIILTD